MFYRNAFCFVLLHFVYICIAQAQKDSLGTGDSIAITRKNTTVKKKNYAPARNALLFGILPGGGQIYNRSYWKLPIVYGGMAGLGYFMADSGIKYQGYRRAYREAVDDDPTTNFHFRLDTDSLDATGLKLQRDKFQDQFEYAALGFAAFYALVLADAFVDAHLKDFDISDDLSMGLRPKLQYDQSQNMVLPSVRLTFRRRYVQGGGEPQARW